MFFGEAKKGKPILLADVEGSSAAIAIALVHGDDPVQVLVSERVSLPIAERSIEQAKAGLPNLFKELMDRVIKKYTEEGGLKSHGSPNAIYTIVGAPWVHARTAHAETIFPEARPITSQMIQALARDAIQQPSELNPQSLLETTVMRVQINGYPTAKPIGKRGVQLAVTSYQSDIDQTLRQSIESVFGAALPGRSITLKSRLRALLSVMQERTQNRHFLIVSVGTETTECIAVRKDEIAEHSVVAEGTTTLVKRIAGEKGLPDESTSLLRMLADDTCAAPACEELKAGLARTEPELTKLFGETFASLTTIRKLPNDLVLLAHDDFSPWLEHFFARLDLAPFTMTTQPFRVHPMTPEHLNDAVTWSPGVKADTSLAVAALLSTMKVEV